MTYSHRWFTCVLIGLFFSATAFGDLSTDASGNTTFGGSGAGGKEYQVLQDRPDRLLVELPNRMIVMAQRMPAAPVVSAQVWVKTGSIYEQEHVGAGLSHFLEHLVSGGSTVTRTEEQSNAILGSIGGQTNAATSLDTVRYYINTTSDHAPEAIALLSDWLANAQITQAEYDRERDVIQREFEMGEGEPRRIFWKLSQKARYPEAHPARHPTIGYLDEFLTVTRDEIYDFYKRMYVPNNMVFVVAGDIDPRKVIDQVTAIWKDVPAGALPELELPATTPERTHVVGYADIKRPKLRLMWPNAPLGTTDDYALDVLGIVLGNGESSRLVRTLRDEKQMVTSIDAYNFSAPWGEAFFGVDAEVAEFDLANNPVQPIHAIAEIDEQSREWALLTRLDLTEKAIRQVIDQVQQDGITEEELARAKRMVIAFVLQAAQTADGMASRLARDVINHQDPDYLSRYAQAIEAVTIEQVQAAAKKYLEPDRAVVVQLQPLAFEEKEASTDATADALSKASETQSDPKPIDLDNRALVEQLEKNLKAGDVMPVAIDPPQLFTLDNGARLIVQRSTLVPAVSMQAYVLGGLLGDTPGREGVSNAMAAMLRRGTQQYAADEFSAKLDSLGASLGAASGNNTWYVRGNALTEDWPTVFEMMAELMQRPTFPQEEWQRMQPRLVAAIDRQASQWSGELGQQFRQAYFADHPWSQTTLGRREVIAALTADDLKAFHKQQLNPSNMIVAIVGDVQPDEALKLTEQYFGDLSNQRVAKFEPPQPKVNESAIIVVETDKPTTAVHIGLGPGIDRTSGDYPAMQVLSRVLSDIPSGYLHRALRGEGKGLVYAAWGYPRVGVVPGSYEIVFNTSPADVPKAVAASLDVVERLKQGEISDADLQRAKAKLLTQEMMGKQSNNDRATEYALDTLYGVNQGLDEYLAAVNAITIADVQRVAGQYLNNPVVVVVSPSEIDTAAVEQTLEAFNKTVQH